jgi:hypothetical protein
LQGPGQAASHHPQLFNMPDIIADTMQEKAKIAEDSKIIASEIVERPSGPVGSGGKSEAQLSLNYNEDKDGIRKSWLVRQESSMAIFMKRLPATVPIFAQPNSPWLVFWLLAGIGSYARERYRQIELTSQPLVFHQKDDDKTTQLVQQIVSRIPSLTKVMKPTMLVGTWSVLNSMAAYLKIGPPRRRRQHAHHDEFHFREIMTMPHDGAKIAVDWELPKRNNKFSPVVDQKCVLKGPICTTVVLILHGINNDSSFGYIRSAMRSCTDRGWVAAGLNFRGCGGKYCTLCCVFISRITF